jgi:hypothetical protein
VVDGSAVAHPQRGAVRVSHSHSYRIALSPTVLTKPPESIIVYYVHQIISAGWGFKLSVHWETLS